MPDKTLTCRDCGQQFVFTQSEQDFYASKGFTNEPSRCPECRAARKAARGDSYSGGGGGYRTGGRREMFPAVCSRCGKQTEVPFQPTSGKPVYCSDCFALERGGSSGYRSGGGRNRY
jgi:CxxC-x17-CxxC domain-containing protein